MRGTDLKISPSKALKFLVAQVCRFNAVFVFFVVVGSGQRKENRSYYAANTVKMVCSFFSQILLCVIFCKLGDKKDDAAEEVMSTRKSSLYIEVRSESWDGEADL